MDRQQWLEEAPGVTVDGGAPRPVSGGSPEAPTASGAPHARRATTRVPEATVARLAVYLRVLTEMLAEDVRTVSSDVLAAAAGVNAAKLRKDLSHIGSSGVRGVGYDVSRLTAQVETVLGLTHSNAVALVGVGNLGHALAGYGGFAARGFGVTALFDVDPALVGTTIAGVEVLDVSEIPRVCAARGVTIGVVATPAAAAQPICDALVGAGVQSILNFAPTVLSVPAGVEVRKVDLAVEMQILAFHVSRRDDRVVIGATGREPAAGDATGKVFG